MQRTDKFTSATWANSRDNLGDNYKSYIVRGAEVDQWNIGDGRGAGLRFVYEFLNTPLKVGEVIVNSAGLGDSGYVRSALPSQFGVWTLDSQFKTVEWNTATKKQITTVYKLQSGLDYLAAEGTTSDKFILDKFGDLLGFLGDSKTPIIAQIADKLSSIYFWTRIGTVVQSFEDSQKSTGDNIPALTGDPSNRNSILPLLVSGVGLATGNPVFIGLGFALRVFGARK
jgi:hypothetical protein